MYRDFAPLPSVVQAAGRCNRSFGNELGDVILWRLSSPATDRLPSQLIYGLDGDRLSPTSTALGQIRDGNTIPELTMLTEGVERYYDALHSRDHRGHHYDRLVEAYNQARGQELRSASLIDEHGAEAVVVTSDAEHDAVAKYLTAKASGDYREAENTMDTLQQLLGSASEERIEELETTARSCEALGFDLDTDEILEVIDNRSLSVYNLRTGAGLYAIEP